MKPAIHTLLVYILFICSGSLVTLEALDERSITIGGEQRWQAAEHRSGVTELGSLRPWPVLALSSGTESPAPLNRGLPYDPPGNAEAPDLILTFDEESPDLFGSRGGRYSIIAPGAAGTLLSSAGPEWARHGEGAAFFSTAAGPGPLGKTIPPAAESSRDEERAGPLVIIPRSPEALFAAGRRVRDFSLEFWLYPLNVGNGEQILSWSSSRSGIQGAYYFQHIRCSVQKNRLAWDFGGFFTSPGGEETLNAVLNGSSTVVPKLWSHHLIRFDADSGLLEYLVNGSVESIVYLTDTGAEGGEVYSPLIGEGGEFVLGKGYTGLLDEFRIHRRYAGRPGREFGLEGTIQKYPPAGGRVETRAFDLGAASGAVLRLEALGGRIRLGGNSKINDYAGQGPLSFADNSAIQFFIRAGDNPYRWTESDWQVVEAGTELNPVLRGRYVQIAANLYPGAAGETSPYLEELRIVYRPNEIPRPPSRLSVLVRDGGVELSWRNPTGDRPDGYLVYYGTARGEYFGTGVLQGPSPINAGKRTVLRLEGLDNGILYYIAVASYRIIPGSGKADELLIGEFSQEVTVRPLLAYNIPQNE
ncbi:MAG: hypothetical protein LBG07_02245 [Treponema sp.]|jgi:hypothetical protein|nr:hypothetical protein [Treponema sp.]